MFDYMNTYTFVENKVRETFDTHYQLKRIFLELQSLLLKVGMPVDSLKVFLSGREDGDNVFNILHRCKKARWLSKTFKLFKIIEA